MKLSTVSEPDEKPIVMCFSGLDPTGGAGIQADIETCLTLGAHCTPIITTLTTQNTQDAINGTAVPAAVIIEQARTILEDMAVKCFKIGLLDDQETVQAIQILLNDYPHIPVIVDPILSAGGGHCFSSDATTIAIRDLLLPKTLLLLPNIDEAKAIASEADNLEACAYEIMDLGSEYVLITGTHRNTSDIEHLLYGHNQLLQTYSCERLPGNYHGSGCTLSSAVACLVAHGVDVLPACREAITFTLKTLKGANRLGMGQLIPNRAVSPHKT